MPLDYPQLILLLASGLLALYGVYRFARLLFTELTSPLRKLRGPESHSWIYGNFKDTWNDHGPITSTSIQEQWFEKYGPTVAHNHFFNIHRRFETIDTKAVQHILKHNEIYHKPEGMRYILNRVLGHSVLITEGDKHRLQRKVMNPAFGPSQIRELTETFIVKSIQLRDIWAAQLSRQDGSAEFDAVSWLSKATLDIIGSTGFDYNFNALNDEGSVSELDEAFSTLFRTPPGVFTPWRILQASIPILRIFPEFMDTAMSSAIATTKRMGREFLAKSKAYYTGTGEKGEKWGEGGRDLLSLLVRSNLSTESEVAKEHRMDDDDVVAQVPTFLIAGHETTSISTTWALYALAQNPFIQARLREELLLVPTESPTMDELNALPYLDAFVREVLRLYPPVVRVTRVATKDDTIPLCNPVTNVDGDVLEELSIKKGQLIGIHIAAINRNKALWGEDAEEFKPERWQQMPAAVSTIPGVWGNLLTFLGGPRACIGWRFSLVETKSILFTLVRSFEFTLAVPNEDIWVKRAAGVQRPAIKGGPILLPLIVKPVGKSI